ncbi:MAG: hypothetical protein JNG88_10995 [Phycisphaerales bacterium]|nr:hypothetical protein [Phycisphaerales bacterium]
MKSITLLSFRTIGSGKNKSNFMKYLKEQLQKQGWKNTGENEYALLGDREDAAFMVDKVNWFLSEMKRNNIKLSNVSIQFHRVRNG